MDHHPDPALRFSFQRLPRRGGQKSSFFREFPATGAVAVMSKWKEKYEKGRKYKNDWEKEYPWVEALVVKESNEETGAESCTTKARCKVCDKILLPRKASIRGHQETTEHKNRIESRDRSARLNFPAAEGGSRKVKNATKVAELKLACTICCHCAVLSVDHIGEVVKECGYGSSLEKIRVHRTKCSRLISNVISPSYKDELKKAMAGKKFSLLTDESTDISSDKHAAFAARYFDETPKKIETVYLGIIQVLHTTGEALFDALKEQLASSGLEIENCVGYGSDGTNSMIGENNSLWTRIKEAAPLCRKMPCTCHSLALCVQHSFEKLPSNLGYMLKEIPGWFRKSALRRDAFSKLFDLMNSGGEDANRSVKKPFQKMSATRWLVRGKIMNIILENWYELLAYFSMESMSGTQQTRFKARQLKDMLRDEVNRLYFHFATPIVQQFEKVNALF